MYWMEKESITLERPESKRIYTGMIPQKRWYQREGFTSYKAVMQP